MKPIFRLFFCSICSAAFAATLLASANAYAQREHRPPPRPQHLPPQRHWWRPYPGPYPGPHPGPWVHADISPWYGGRWVHTWHDGRIGWWWVVGTIWYFYTVPIYPYPNPYTPPVVVVTPPANAAAPATPAPPAVQYWYYCPSSKSYFPYVSSCPEGWTQVPATPPAPGG